MIAAAFCSALTAGCATLPTEHVDQVSGFAVQERVKCELGDAYRRLQSIKGAPDLSKWAAGLTLTLAVDATGGITPSTSLAGPYGSVTPLDLGFGVSGNAKRTALMNVFVSFVEATKHKCPDASPIPIEGGLGLSDWIVRVFTDQIKVNEEARRLGSVLAGSDFDSKDKSIGYSLDFLLTLSASATPNFVIPNATGKILFGYESKSTHSVDIAMVEMSDAVFKEHFETVVLVPEHTVTKRVLKSDPNNKTTFLAEEKIVVPAKIKRSYVGKSVDIGDVTRARLDGILLQLNNKVLLQTLRR
jgi:hypothetical protein